ncbi:twin-arginine translocase subunit TatC [Modestobacter roseus]|uniref:Sec-independent protein translocase protein TatC n=1 Tax=Modestobacter roseus TaxID=1181884 RepID=A0A562IPI8_9ACTN|nr:twin-arginine translocase subunit TatC [Modestobacter roseus]MQA34610.1 twin-arginine translocase subunit TatC [Modestobacter roseus]TWH72838.1 sec-independent protein translocase protein TatC [Modestobacter roseus]
MSLIGHLREFRNRVAKALLALLIGTAVAFWWYDHGLGDFIRAPYCGLDPELRFGDGPGECGLLITDVFGGVFIRLKVSFLCGAVLAAPVWLYQLWAFVTPGLKRNEKRYGVGFVAVSSTLFALGAVLAYISLSAGLELLLSLAGDGTVVALTAQDYIGFVLSLLIAFGVSFEVPLLAVALNLVGVLSHETLSKGRRWIFFLTIVFAAFITPTQDPFTMLLMAGPMIVLFEIAIQIARFVDRRRAKKAAAAGLAGLDDDEASPFVGGPSSLDTAPSRLGSTATGLDTASDPLDTTPNPLDTKPSRLDDPDPLDRR